MHRTLFALLLTVALTALVGTVPAKADGIIVIGFDDVALNQPVGSISSAWADLALSYDGFDWEGWEVMSQTACVAIYGACASPPSPSNFAYGGNDTTNLTISASNPFLFDGAQFSHWDGNVVGALTSVTIYGYLNSNPVGSVTVNLASGYLGSGGITGAVDKLVFPVSGVFQMDNFQTESVPEPATLTMISGALLALGFLGRRKFKTR
jgi:hypothetical protein